MGIDCGIVGSHHMCHGENKVLPYTVMVTHTILDILMIGIEIPLKMHWIFPSPFLGKHPIFWPWHTKPYHCKSDIQKTKYRKSPYLMRKTMVSCRFSLKPIHCHPGSLPRMAGLVQRCPAFGVLMDFPGILEVSLKIGYIINPSISTSRYRYDI